MNESVSVLLVGLGGYGENYVKEFLESKDRDDFKIVGAVDPYPENCSQIDEIKERDIPIYSSIEEFYKDDKADFVCIASPIQFHSRQIITALEKGAHVLCEKPLSPTVQEGKEILKAEKEADKLVGIGYQWSYSDAIQALKKDIIADVLGKPVRLKTLVAWPRNFAYYNRNNWAGKIKDSKGNWILDSVASNATAHYLHNMYYVLGTSIEESAYPQKLETELYRANDIENFDTAATRIFTNKGIELLYIVTHATKKQLNPRFCYEFEKATVYFDQDKDSQIIAEFRDGSKKVYGDPFKGSFKKIWIMLDAIKGSGSYLCGVEAALPHVISINGMQETVKNIVEFPADLIKLSKDESGNETAVYVEGLADVIEDCYKHWKLPNDLGAKWARPAGEIELTGYNHYPKKN